MSRRVASPVLIGRTSELEAFEAALESARRDVTSVLLVGGDAGIGKTRLVSAFAERTKAVDGHVVVGSCPPVGSDAPIPYAPVARAVRAIVRSLEPADLERIIGPGREALGLIIPELGRSGAAASEHDPFAQIRLFEAIVGTLERVARWRPPLLLVLEDLHWADPSTRTFLATLLSGMTAAPAVIVGTYRSDALRPGDPLHRLVEELDRYDHVERLELLPLGEAAVEDLVSNLVDETVERSVVRTIVRRSGGSPYLVEELAAVAMAGDGERLPSSVLATTRVHLEAISAPARSIVDAAAVAADAVAAATLAEVTGLGQAAVAGGLREAIDARLLVRVPSAGTDLFEFRHALAREAVYSLVMADERRELHARIGRVLQRHGQGSMAGQGSLVHASLLAAHLSAAGDPAAAPALVAAGKASEEAFAFEEAHRFYALALELSEASDDPAAWIDPVEVLERAAECASLAGRPGRAVELARRILARPDAEVPTDALRVARLARFLWESGDRDAALDQYRTAVALAEGGPAAVQARVLAAFGRALMLLGQYRLARETTERAIQVARDARAPDEEEHALATLGVAMAMSGAVEDGLARLTEANRIAERRARRRSAQLRPSRIPDALRDHLDRAAVLARSGDLTAAVDVALEGRAIAHRTGVSDVWGDLLEARAAIDLFLAGRWAEADALTAPVAAQTRRGQPALHLARAMLDIARGDFDAGSAHLDASSPLKGPAGREAHLAGRWEMASADASLWQRRPAIARETVRDGLTWLVEAEDEVPVRELAVLGLRAEAEIALRARARRRMNELAATADTVPALATLARTAADGTTRPSPRSDPVLDALTASATAELARFEGDESPDPWATAAAAWQRAGQPYRAAYAHWREAEAVLESGDRVAARRPIEAALAIALELGATPLRREIEALARRARVRLEPAATVGERAGDGEGRAKDRFGLSQRESDVLVLLAEGLTNRAIAERLFVTEKTVEHHVSSILGKLGASRRGEAAALAYRAGLLDDPRAGDE